MFFSEILYKEVKYGLRYLTFEHNYTIPKEELGIDVRNTLNRAYINVFFKIFKIYIIILLISELILRSYDYITKKLHLSKFSKLYIFLDFIEMINNIIQDVIIMGFILILFHYFFCYEPLKEELIWMKYRYIKYNEKEKAKKANINNQNNNDNDNNNNISYFDSANDNYNENIISSNEQNILNNQNLSSHDSNDIQKYAKVILSINEQEELTDDYEEFETNKKQDGQGVEITLADLEEDNEIN